MRTDRKRAALALTLIGTLAGCTTGSDQHPFVGWGDGFGEATKQTLAAQIIDPEPVYDTALEGSGEHAAQAAERYRTDKVKKPERMKTSDVSGNAASAGGNQ